MLTKGIRMDSGREKLLSKCDVKMILRTIEALRAGYC